LANAWKGLKILSGQANSKMSTQSMPLEEQKAYADELNDFYCRFEREDHKHELQSVLSNLQQNVCDNDSDEEDFTVHATDVKSVFKALHVRKAVGVDGICGRLLKSCAEQLCHVFSDLFSLSLKACHFQVSGKNQ